MSPKDEIQIKLFGPNEIDHIAWLTRQQEMERVVDRLMEIKNTVGLKLQYEPKRKT